MKKGILIILVSALITACEKNSDNSLLIKMYGDSYEDIGFSVAETEGGYLIAGQTTLLTRESTSSGTIITGSSKKMIILSTDRDGNQEGSPQILGGDLIASGTHIISLSDGSAVAAGHVTDPVTQQADIFVVKIGNDGNVVAEKTFAAPGNQYSKDIIQAGSGFIVLGTTDVERQPVSNYTGNAAGKKDALLLRLNNNLEKLQDIPAQGFIGNDEPSVIKPDNYGGYIITGTTDRSEKPAAEQAGTNIFVFRINADGSITQIRIIGGVANETASDMEVLSDGYLVAGTTGNEGTDQKGYVWKLTNDIFAAPEFQYPVEITPSATYTIKAMCRYKSSSFLLAGQHGTGLSSRMLVMAIDALGNPIPGKILITGGTGTQSANDVISDEDGNIIAVGRNSYENNSMITFLKFRF